MFDLEVHDQVMTYIDTAKEKMRWKRAKKLMELELSEQLYDEIDQHVQEGLSEAEAVKAVFDKAQAPEVVGDTWDKQYRPKIAWKFGIFVLTLIFIGFAFYLVTVSVNDLFMGYVTKSLFVMLGCGILLWAVICLIDYTLYFRYAKLLYTVLCLLSLGVFYYESTYRNGFDWLNYIFLFFPILWGGLLFYWKNHNYALLKVSLFALFPMLLAGYMMSAVLLIYLFLSYLFIIGYGIWQKWLPLSLLDWIFFGVNAVYIGYNVFYLTYHSPYVYDASKLLESASFIGYITAPIASDQLFNHLESIIQNHPLIVYIQQFGWLPVIVILWLGLVFLFFFLKMMYKENSALGKLLIFLVMVIFFIQGVVGILDIAGIFLTTAESPFLIYPPFLVAKPIFLVINLMFAGLVSAVVYQQTIGEKLLQMRLKQMQEE